jgi:hypothetical protein
VRRGRRWPATTELINGSQLPSWRPADCSPQDLTTRTGTFGRFAEIIAYLSTFTYTVERPFCNRMTAAVNPNPLVRLNRRGVAGTKIFIEARGAYESEVCDPDSFTGPHPGGFSVGGSDVHLHRQSVYGVPHMQDYGDVHYVEDGRAVGQFTRRNGHNSQCYCFFDCRQLHSTRYGFRRIPCRPCARLPAL